MTAPAPTQPLLGGERIAGEPAKGPYMRLDVLSAAVAAGDRLWLADVQGRLVSVAATTEAIVTDRMLSVAVADTPGLVLDGGTLIAFGRDEARNVRVLRIDTRTGKEQGATITAGRPLGQAFLRDGVLVVADYDRGLVKVDPATGRSEPLVNLGLVPDLAQPGPAGATWVVDDARQRVVLFDATGTRQADVSRPGSIRALAADGPGNAWIAEGGSVVAFGPDGTTLRQVDGFANAAFVRSCGKDVVASDVGTGLIAWFDANGADRRLPTDVPGAVIACAIDGGVWFLSAEGSLAHLSKPT